MESIIVYAHIDNIDKIMKIPRFKPVYEYIHGNNVVPEEWGKVILGNVEIKFYVSDKIKYSSSTDSSTKLCSMVNL
jgi:hypothetical protein